MKNRLFKYILLLIFVFTILLGIFFMKKSNKNILFDEVNISEISDIDYKVYLKENNFFETPYLEKNNIYITSLIDYIDVNFNYKLKLSDQRSGTYTYQIKAIMSAETENNTGSYWNKEYILYDSKTESFDSNNTLFISKNVKIDYQAYNDALLEFKKKYGLSINGKLSIKLYIDTNINSDIEPLINSAICTLEIPLTKSTIEVPIVINSPNNNKLLKTKEITKSNKKYSIYKIISYVLYTIGTISVVVFITLVLKNKSRNYNYKNILNKILKTYDGIIVNSDVMPNLSNLNVIKALSFDELIDAHSELRLPIIYYNDEKTAIFTLINNNIAWQYILEKRIPDEKK